jgi:hypothetical protein
VAATEVWVENNWNFVMGLSLRVYRVVDLFATEEINRTHGISALGARVKIGAGPTPVQNDIEKRLC